MRKFAARKCRDRLVGEAFRAGQAHVDRPLLLLAPAGLGKLAFGIERLPSLRPVLVEVGMMAALPQRHREKASLARAVAGLVEHHDAVPCAWRTPSIKGCNCGI